MEETGWEEEPWEKDGFIETALSEVNIIDILEKYGLEHQAINAGNFSHKMFCPFPEHQDGQERTASLYISEDSNSFYCFGCNSGSSIIDFLMLYLGVPLQESLKILNEFMLGVEIRAKKKKSRDPEHKVITQVYRVGVMVRECLKRIDGDDRSQWVKWGDKVFSQLDNFLDNLDDENWEKVKLYGEKVNRFINKKLGEHDWNNR